MAWKFSLADQPSGWEVGGSLEAEGPRLDYSRNFCSILDVDSCIGGGHGDFS